MRQRRRKVGVVIGLLVIAGVGVGGIYWATQVRAQQSGGLAFNVVSVDRGAVVQSIRATGAVQPVREVQVGSQISGRIEALFVDFNSPVVEGQLIAQLDTSTHEAEVALRRAELESAQAVLELAQLQQGRLSSLHERDMTTRESLDQVTLERRQAEAQVAIRKSNLSKAELELERCSIFSPTDGMVISRNVDVGQTVAASLSAPVLFTIADDLSRMQIIANVSEADIGRLSLGQRVEFRVDAYRDDNFHGEVIQIRNAPRILDNVVTYDTVIAIDNSHLKLKPGMTAEVFIVTDEAEDVLRVRNAALRARLPEAVRPTATRPDSIAASARMVYALLPGGTLQSRWIETGISDGMYTEVLAGLEVGQELVTGLQLRREGGDAIGGSLLSGQQAQF